MSETMNDEGSKSPYEKMESGLADRKSLPFDLKSALPEDSDDVQETDDQRTDQNRRLATFSLSSDAEESTYASDDNHSTSTIDPEEEEEPKESDRKMWLRQRELRLSLILGISADEKCEKQLAMHLDDDDSLLDIERFGKVHPADGQEPRTRKLAQTVGPVNVDATDFHEDREFDFLRSISMRRSSSLKTNKTPPGTPHRKKAVRFADVLGLDLANVRHIMNLEEPPIIPLSAMRDLNLQNQQDDRYAVPALVQVRHLCTCFSQPGCCPDFLRRVLERKVSLETCAVDDELLTVSGIVRVANVAYQKNVIVRYTINGWMTYTDDAATYVSESNDGATDRFMFTIHLPDYFAFGSRLEFSILFSSGDQAFWDSNFGNNYRVECYFNMELPAEPESIKEGRFY